MIDVSGFSDEVPAGAMRRYAEWSRFLYGEVDFSMGEFGPHTRDHCARVLLYAMVIADRMGLDDDERDAVAMACVFHDTRRKDDWYDVGHGRRAADHYREVCSAGRLPFDERTYVAMAYHDRDDSIGEAEISGKPWAESGLRVYRVLKDADGLDRHRLGPGALDVGMLRTPEGRSMADFARRVVEATGGVPDCRMC